MPLGEFETARLPWGAQIRVRPTEVIGSNIWCYGVFDLMVTEAISRLVDPGELCLDIGANIGQMTSLMRHWTGSAGQVLSFEPHPDVFAELEYNLQTVPTPTGSARVELHNIALSEHPGEARLELGASWQGNRGTGKISASSPSPTADFISVKVDSLDRVLGGNLRVGVCKIDVEGHELQVFKGAARLLSERRIRDIVLEDFGSFPSPVHKHLMAAGFTFFSLNHSFLRPRLLRASTATKFATTNEGENYLATLEPTRAEARFRRLGWRSLGKRV